MQRKLVIGIDVGTGSVRAGVFDLTGTMAGYASADIRMWKPAESFAEQSTPDIWDAACRSVREAIRSCGASPADVVGLSFDATCSLVALGDGDLPVSVSPSGEAERNVIVWMDHRATEQARRITRTRHRVLANVGGVMSPEMEPPKLLWLKEELPETWKSARKFLDLADFMVYRATGVDVRSLCTTVCKWTYDGEGGSWDESFFRKVGLGELTSRRMIGQRVLPMGSPAGRLTPESASELGLGEGTMVAVGIIDAHAGGIGLMGMGFDRKPRPAELEKILALIGGTSSCHMAVSPRPRFIRGIWGPYGNAMIPGLWLTEGGQSATGSLLDHTIRASAHYESIKRRARSRQESVYDTLNGMVEEIKRREKTSHITRDLHVLPYFLGNRSPHADPGARGAVSGLTLDDSVESLARLYCATIQAIAYGTRHIIEEMNRHGYRIRRIHACGGGTKNRLWLQEHADITGCPIVLPREPEAVLLGTAILAAVGAGLHGSIMDAAVAMSHAGERYTPQKSSARFHAAKYRVFHQMYRDFKRQQKIMNTP